MNERKLRRRFCGNCEWGETKHDEWMDEDDRTWPEGYPVECQVPLPMSITYPEGGGTYERTPAESCYFWKRRPKAKPL